MLHNEITSVCSEIHKQHTNVLSEQNVDFFFILKLVVHIVTTRLLKVNRSTTLANRTTSLTSTSLNQIRPSVAADLTTKLSCIRQ